MCRICGKDHPTQWKGSYSGGSATYYEYCPYKKNKPRGFADIWMSFLMFVWPLAAVVAFVAGSSEFNFFNNVVILTMSLVATAPLALVYWACNK